MKRLLSLVSLFLGLNCLPALAQISTVYDTKALDPTLPIQICNKVQEIKRLDGVRTRFLTLTPSNLRMREAFIEMAGNNPCIELLLEGKTDPTNPDVEQMRQITSTTAVRFGDHVVPGAGLGVRTDGSWVLTILRPTDADLAVVRGETPDAPASHISLSLAPLPQTPNQFVLTLRNDGTGPQTLVCGDGGTDNNPKRDPMLNLFGFYQNRYYLGVNLDLPLGGLKQPFVLAPGESRSRVVNVADYLTFGDAGDCNLTVHYTLQFKNTNPDKGPKYWGVGLESQLHMPIAPVER